MMLEEFFKGYIEEDMKKVRKYGLSVNDAFEIMNAHYNGKKDIVWVIKEALRRVRLTDKGDRMLYYNCRVTGRGHPHHIRDHTKFLELSIYQLPEAFLVGLLVKIEEYFNANCDRWIERAACLDGMTLKEGDPIYDHATAVCSETYYTESLRFTSDHHTDAYSMRAILDSIEEYKNNR